MSNVAYRARELSEAQNPSICMDPPTFAERLFWTGMILSELLWIGFLIWLCIGLPGI